MPLEGPALLVSEVSENLGPLDDLRSKGPLLPINALGSRGRYLISLLPTRLLSPRPYGGRAEGAGRWRNPSFGTRGVFYLSGLILYETSECPDINSHPRSKHPQPSDGSTIHQPSPPESSAEFPYPLHPNPDPSAHYPFPNALHPDPSAHHPIPHTPHPNPSTNYPFPTPHNPKSPQKKGPPRRESPHSITPRAISPLR